MSERDASAYRFVQDGDAVTVATDRNFSLAHFTGDGHTYHVESTVSGSPQSKTYPACWDNMSQSWVKGGVRSRVCLDVICLSMQTYGDRILDAYMQCDELQETPFPHYSLRGVPA